MEGARERIRIGYLWKYAQQVGPAVNGAVTHPGGAAEKSAMRTAESLLRALLISGLLAAAPAHALDGSKTDASVGPPPMTPMEAFRSGANWLKASETVKAVNSLEYAAEKGHAIAQWKLGRMYAEGDGVTQNDLKAFEYFRRIADSHADDNPDTPQARFVANAFVALGHYYLDGIPKTDIKRDPQRAREMFAYAASYFRDPDAQYLATSSPTAPVRRASVGGAMVGPG